MSNTPFVSVIVPIYNTEKYLRECVDSIRNQTLRNIEIILVDDGSPDNSPEICDEYEKMDSRIKVIHKSNQGLGFARNSGMEIASGEFIAFVDSDDFVANNMFELMYMTAKKYNADEVRCGTLFYDGGTSKERRNVNSDAVFCGKNEVLSFVLDLVGPLPSEKRDVKYMISAWGAIHSRKVINENNVKFTSERQSLSEDMIFDLDLLPKMNCIVCIPDCLYYYRLNLESLSHFFSMEKYKRYSVFFSMMKKRLDCISEEKEYILHYYRSQFLYLRNVLKGVFNKSENYFSSRVNARQILNDQLWHDLLSYYPYRQMDWKHRLYFFVLKHKWCFILSIIHQQKLWDYFTTRK